jgi:chromosome segregation ATPase
MKTKAGLIILIVICLGLGIALLQRNRQAAEEHQQDLTAILDLSNHWVQASAKINEAEQVNLALQKDLADRKTDISKLSNELSQASESLNKTAKNVADLQAALKTAQDEMAKRDTKIAELESQNQNLDKQASDLKTSITGLETQISDTQKKLAASEGDKSFLEGELKRLMAEKADLERKFNDLGVLRAQVHKLKEEMTIARRLAWIRDGIFANSEEKGAQKLMQPGLTVASAKPPTNAYDLNVEIKSDGSVKIIEPLTNAVPSVVKPGSR